MSSEVQQLLLQAGHRRRYCAGDTIVSETSDSRSLFWLANGQAAIRLSNWRGHEVILGYVDTGGFFGEMGLFPNDASRFATVVATRECLALEIGYDRFRRIANANDSLWLALIAQVSYRLRDANRRLVDTGLLRVQERLLAILHQLAATNPVERAADGPMLKITRQELGHLVGCTREVAGRTLKQLEENGAVRLDGHSIIVVDRQDP